MTTVPNDSYDPRFDEAEINRGDPWRFREPDAPNPLTILVAGWSSGFTKHGETEFLNGVDRDGRDWSVLVGSLVLRKRLIDGEVTEWDDERKAFAVIDTQGRVQPGEVVSIRYLGDRESGNGKSYPDFTVVRKPAAPLPTEAEEIIDEIVEEIEKENDDLPF